MKGKRELEQDGAETIGALEDVEAVGGDGDVDVGGGIFVSEFAPEFGGEKEARVGGDAFDPLFGVGGLHGMVEGRVDFDGVEKFGEERGFVEVFGAGVGVEDFFPVGIGPAGGADIELGFVRL